MPYTVAASFEKFRENIELKIRNRSIAAQRRNHIVSIMKDNYTIIEAFPTGSIPRYTALQGYADLDVMVALHPKHIRRKKPSHVLQLVRDCFADYKTIVRKNGQAVTLYYKSWPHVDIVPVLRTLNNQNISRYMVPDMNREVWIISKPKIHTFRLALRNRVCGKAFKHIIKMIKWWNFQHSSLLQSFHIEVLALKILRGKLKDYSWDVFKFFDKAWKLVDSPSVYDGSKIDDYLDKNTRNEVVKRLKKARNNARRAWILNHRIDNNCEAIQIWRQIFGEKFPTYG